MTRLEWSRGRQIVRLLIIFSCLFSCSGVYAAEEFPRIGIKWHGLKDVFLESGIGVLEAAVAADVILINPNPGPMRAEYRNRIAEIHKSNPRLLVFQYMNITEFQPDTGVFKPVTTVLTDYYVNPNRGGGNTANDGWLRAADGTIVSYFGNNQSTNFSDFVAPYDGRFGIASSDNDITKPRLQESMLDYMTRVNYFIRVQPVEDFIDGVYEDLFRRWPKRSADWDNNGTNEGAVLGSTLAARRMWRNAHIKNRNNIVGKNYTGTGTNNARSDGRAWLRDGGYFLGNVSAWSLPSQVLDSMDSGVPMERIPEYDGVLFGGVHEGVIGRSNGVSGLAADGSRGTFKVGSLDLALTSFNFGLSHNRPIPELGYSVTLFETYSSTLDMARYAFASGSLVDGVVSLRTYIDGKPWQPPWLLDEFVGADIDALSLSEIARKRKWLGRALDPAYPGNPKQQNGRIHLREFENGLVIVLAGKSHNDDHLSLIVTAELPDPGLGFEWRRINGGQDKSWNHGRVESGTVTLGTQAPNINGNAIILRRVATGANPKPPVLTVE